MCKITIILFLTVAVLGSGCGDKIPPKHFDQFGFGPKTLDSPIPSVDQMLQDKWQCEKDARTMNPNNIKEAETDFFRCMEMKGWKRIK
jgi:hypothetical protein